MNEAHFQVLGFTAPLGLYTFHDDGYVSSISDKNMQLNNLYGLDNSDYDINKDKRTIGRCYWVDFDLHIFYLKRPTRASDIQNRSHEETHVLDHIGQLDVLTDRLMEEQCVKINMKEVDDKELRAQLGSLYALNSRGFGNMWAYYNLGLIYEHDTFTTAKKMYKQAKQSRKRFFIF